MTEDLEFPESYWPTLLTNAETRFRNVTAEMARCRNLSRPVHPDHWKRLERSLKIARDDMAWAKQHLADNPDAERLKLRAKARR
jgi:hypothetical protein